MELSIKEEYVESLIPNMDTSFKLTNNISKFYKFESSDFTDRALININYMSITENDLLKVRIEPGNAPSSENQIVLTVTHNEVPFASDLEIEENTWYYIRFDLKTTETRSETDITFHIKLFACNITDHIWENKGNSSAITKISGRSRLTENTVYDEYSLIRVANSDNFVYAMTIPEQNETTPQLNLATSKFTVLKFNLREYIDFGGSLRISVAFKISEDDKTSLEQVQQNYLIVGCIEMKTFQQPKHPNKCVLHGIESEAPLLLNETAKNASALIPLPPAGNWFVSFGLFEKIQSKSGFSICSDDCQVNFTKCIKKCQIKCIMETYCENCHHLCQQKFAAERNLVTMTTEENVTIVFEIISNPCTPGNCGNQGRCIITVSQGIVFSTCSCRRNYRGRQIHKFTN